MLYPEVKMVLPGMAAEVAKQIEKLPGLDPRS
jgi:hypothetical protein